MSKTLSQLECVKRTKELDAREEYLKGREEILASAPITIEVLQKTIVVKKRQLSDAEQKIEAANFAYTQRVLEIRAELSGWDEKVDVAQSQLNTINALTKTLESNNSSLKSEAKDLKKELIETGKYKSEQEKLMADAIEEGNATLKSLKYEIDGLEDVKKNTNYEIAILNTTVNDVEDAILEIGREQEDLQKSYNETKLELDQNLRDINKQIDAAATKYGHIADDVDKKLAILKQRELEITAKRDALRLEHEEIETEKRRWNSTQALYDEV